MFLDFFLLPYSGETYVLLFTVLPLKVKLLLSSVPSHEPPDEVLWANQVTAASTAGDLPIPQAVELESPLIFSLMSWDWFLEENRQKKGDADVWRGRKHIRRASRDPNPYDLSVRMFQSVRWGAQTPQLWACRRFKNLKFVSSNQFQGWICFIFLAQERLVISLKAGERWSRRWLDAAAQSEAPVFTGVAQVLIGSKRQGLLWARSSSSFNSPRKCLWIT